MNTSVVWRRSVAAVALLVASAGAVAITSSAANNTDRTAASTATATTAAAARAASAREINGSPVADVLTNLSDDVLTYHEHITVLAAPFMEGRVPGSRGMEITREYVRYFFEKYGMEPAFPSEDGDFTTWSDPFELGGTWQVTEETMIAVGPGGTVSFEPETQFVYTGLGGDGRAAGQAVFVGYAIDEGPDGFSSFGDDTDLDGKVALLFRFEPLDAQGRSRWTGGQNFSAASSFNNKLSAVAERGAAAAIVINPPGIHDGRPDTLARFGRGGGGVDIPVFQMTAEAGKALVDALGAGKSLMELRRHADRGDAPVAMDALLTVAGNGEREQLIAENIGGVFPGVGELADEYIILGAHMDHLGLGYFGSRSGPGELHPGADDNASGTAGLMLMAEVLRERIDQLPQNEPRRSIVLIAFDGEESGLNGSRHYVVDPIVPLEQHVLMCNWDMIGRLVDDTVSVSGVGSGQGLLEFIEPFFSSSGLTVVPSDNFLGGSDHLPFFQNQVPVLFGALQRLHEDYHTPADTSHKINRVGATKTVLLFADMVMAVAQTEQRFPFQTAASRAQVSSSPTPRINVRVGILPSYSGDEDGVGIEGVTEGTPAADAGLRAGDRLIRWDGVKITDIENWTEMLAGHEPGDKVKIGVRRNGREITLDLTLGAR